MGVVEKVIIQNKNIQVVHFLWAKPIAAMQLGEEKQEIDNALQDAITNYAKVNCGNEPNYLVLSSHRNPLGRLLGRVVVFSGLGSMNGPLI
jgi:hypothetical protein